MSVPEYKLEDIIKNAIGEKPVLVQKAFDNVIVQKAADIIAGKRDTIAAQYGAQVSPQQEDELNLDDISDEQLDSVLSDEDESEDDLLDDTDLEEIHDEESEEE